MLRDSPLLTSPAPYNAADQRISIWPSTLELALDAKGGEWKLQVRAFSPTWLPLPGNEECWPQAVQLDNQIVPVTSRSGVAAINLTPGLHTVSGNFVWKQ